MTGALVVVPVAAPLLAAAVLALLPGRRILHRTVGLGVNVAVLGLGAALLVQTHDGTVVSQYVSGWPAGVAIVLAGDQLSALLVCLTAVLVTGSLWFAAATRDDARRMFVPLVLVLAAGVYGAYLTADLFNLFVFVEVMLAPSYVLVVLSGARRRVGAGRVYLTVNLLASTVFLAGVGLVYGLTGTVNLGELAGAASRSTPVAVAAGVLLVAMAAKSAVVPLHTWLPRVYTETTPAVAVLFSGLLTKVGVYVIFRVYAVVYDGDLRYTWLLLTVALVTMVVGALAALGERTMRAVLVASMVSHIGFMVLGPALATTAGLAAAIFYLLQYALVKAALLVCSGAVESAYGTGRLDRLGGLVGRAPLLATTFMVAAMSLAGIPPLSGFVAKLALIRGAVEGGQYLAAGLVAGVGVLTLLAVIKIWNQVFWGHDGEVTWADRTGSAQREPVTVRTALVAPAVVLAAGSVVFGFGAEPLLATAEVAAAGLSEPDAYVEAVMPR